ncbi:25099_t:CDS:2 [Racocetra persica]|uniref:25099_t:CDS:1 n=1 Tax=Racocetra persica TaxID=160502 RepID=A0ACA9MX68_9GLOM|nr:25099_t:CDS:2 [Racocetra persica]
MDLKSKEQLEKMYEQMQQVAFEPESNEISHQWDDEINSHWNDTPQNDEKSWNDDRPTYTVDSEEFKKFEEENSSNSNSNQTVEENRSNDSSQDTLVKSNIKYQIELTLLILMIILAPFSFIFVWILGGLLLLRIKIFILKLRLADGDYTTTMNPFKILFSQSTINSSFRNSRNIEETIIELVNDSIRIEDFPHIQVCIIDDMIFSSDNRRLYVFQEAIRRGLKVDKIPIRVRRSTDLNIKWKMEGSYKIVQNDNFKDIIVSQYARNGRVIDKEEFWDFSSNYYM